MRNRFSFALLILLLSLASNARAQEDEGYAAQRDAEAARAVKRLADIDPLIRQRAAEELAQLSAVEHQRLVEGYLLQEKNGRVRLALNWALYRAGQRNALYQIVGDLRSQTRRAQAVGYLSQLSGPEVLKPFFRNADRKSLVGLLEVMARLGNEETLEQIKPYVNTLDPEISRMAQFATREITIRLSQQPSDNATRPRKVDETETSSP